MNRFVLYLLALMLTCVGCGKEKPTTPGSEARRLLELHGLVGKTPADRSRQDKQREVDRELLNDHFVDLASMDKFIGDIYVGVVVSAVAYSQDKLEETIEGNTAVVNAGKLDVHFVKKGNRWQIDLGKTIPDELKQRAQDEKARYKAAKSLGQSLSH